MFLGIALGLILILVVFTMAPLFSKGSRAQVLPTESEERKRMLLDQRNTLHSNLKDLESEYAMGRLDEKDFQDMKASYMSELEGLASQGLSCILLVCLLLFTAGVAEAKEVRGQNVNGTNGKPGACDTLKLIQFGGGMKVVQTLGPVKGKFQFEGDFTPGSPYMLQANYAGVNYSQPFQISDATETVADISVYDVTKTPESITVSVPHLVLHAAKGRLEMMWLFDVNNESKRTFFNQEETFRFGLPKDILGEVQVAVSQGKMPIPMGSQTAPDGEGNVIAYPMKPGVTSVMVTYALDYSKKEASFTTKLFYNLDSLNLYVVPSDVKFSSPQFKTDESVQEHGFSSYKAGPVQAGSLLSFQVSGGSDETPSPTEERQVIEVPAPIDRFKWPLVLALSVIFTGALSYTLGARSRK